MKPSCADSPQMRRYSATCRTRLYALISFMASRQRLSAASSVRSTGPRPRMPLPLLTDLRRCRPGFCCWPTASSRSSWTAKYQSHGWQHTRGAGIEELHEQVEHVAHQVALRAKLLGQILEDILTNKTKRHTHAIRLCPFPSSRRDRNRWCTGLVADGRIADCRSTDWRYQMSCGRVPRGQICYRSIVVIGSPYCRFKSCLLEYK